MRNRSLTIRIVAVLASVLLLMLAAAPVLAVVSDYQVKDVVPNGVTIAGRDLTGMDRTQARTAIENAITAPMMRTVKVTGASKTWEVDPQGIVDIDVDAMVDEAFYSRRTSPLMARLNSDLLGAPLTYEVKPVFSVDKPAVEKIVGDAAEAVDCKAVDATRKVVKYKFKITPEKAGARVDQDKATEKIVEALSADAALEDSSRVVKLPIKWTQPKVKKDSFKTGIIVSLDQCKIYLYKGDKLVKTYMCAPGRPGFPTPQGEFKIDTKLKNAPWINPGSDWAKSMPAMIPPGPSNPMGVRKIGINYSGVFFHGIPASEYGSIGTHASHGCMRMMPSAVEDLFGRVSIGDPVYIKN